MTAEPTPRPAGHAILEGELLRRLRCPACGRALRATPGGARCTGCAAPYPCRDGVWDLLTPAQSAGLAPFLDSYRSLRRQEGWERAPDYYLHLPYVKPSDPVAAVWRIRRRSFARLRRLVVPGHGRWALDLGAGNGWLARHLTTWGYHTVALDLNATGIEGLAGGQLYLEHDGGWFGRVRGTMDLLPFAAASFALCTVSGALHYAPLWPTLAAISRVLTPGGLLAITDSPVYADGAAGAAMAAEGRARARALLGAEPAPPPGGAGYLLGADLDAALRSAGLAPRYLGVERPLGRLRRLLRRHPGAREHAHFPVIAARKPEAAP